MKLVIDIDENIYKATKNGLDADEIWDLRVAVVNGTPLPKGHGRLIDADAFVDFLKNISKTQGYNEFIINKQLTGVTVDDVFNAICESLQDENSAPTIIKADGGNEDEVSD